MGYWGYGLFESDYDLDCMFGINDELGLEEDDDLLYPDDQEATLKLVNSKLTSMFASLRDQDIVLFGAAAAMQLGARLTTKHKTKLRNALEAIFRLRDDDEFLVNKIKRGQMLMALKHYKNGEAYDFWGSGVTDTANSQVKGAEFVEDEEWKKYNIDTDIWEAMEAELKARNDAPSASPA